MNDPEALLVPCTSNVPDRDYDCVALYFNKTRADALAARTRHFEQLRDEDESLYSLEYLVPELNVSSILLDGDTPYDPPDGLERLSDYLSDLGNPEVNLQPLGVTPYLVVTEHGLFITWEGRRDKYGPNETYETETFSPRHITEALEP